VPANSGISFKELNKRRVKFISMDVTPPSELNSTSEIRVDQTVPPGKFCYTICVYDTDGNISLPQTVCVEVEAWGGNNEIVGNWKYEKEETTRNGKTTVTNLNQKDCDNLSGSSTLTCENQETLSYDSYCDTILSLQLNINSDGTQSSLSESTEDRINFELSRDQCKEIRIIEDYKYGSSGNWAYDEEQKKITFIEFVSTETIDGEVVTENTEEIGFDVELISVSSNSLYHFCYKTILSRLSL